MKIDFWTWKDVRNDFKMDDICINIICIMYFLKCWQKIRNLEHFVKFLKWLENKFRGFCSIHCSPSRDFEFLLAPLCILVSSDRELFSVLFLYIFFEDLTMIADASCFLSELFGRPSPSPKISGFENPSDSDSAYLFFYAFIL
jgi:hypothetical protein